MGFILMTFKKYLWYYIFVLSLIILELHLPALFVLFSFHPINVDTLQRKANSLYIYKICNFVVALCRVQVWKVCNGFSCKLYKLCMMQRLWVLITSDWSVALSSRVFWVYGKYSNILLAELDQNEGVLEMLRLQLLKYVLICLGGVPLNY